MPRSIPLLFVLILFTYTTSYSQVDGIWVYDNSNADVETGSVFSDGSFCLQLQGRKFVLTNANDRVIAQNASQWTYLEGRFRIQESILLLKVKRQFYFSTNIGRIVRDLRRRDIEQRELELFIEMDANGDLIILPFDLLPFGGFNEYTLTKGDKMPYYPYSR